MSFIRHLLGTEFALEPRLRFHVQHRIGLAAVDAAQLATARFLYEHKPHCLLTLWTDGRGGLGLRHDSRLETGGSAILSVTE